MGFTEVKHGKKKVVNDRKPKKIKQPAFPTKYYLKPSSSWRDGESELSFSSPKPNRLRLAASPVFHIVHRNPTVTRKPDIVFGSDKEQQSPVIHNPHNPNNVYPDWWFNSFEPDSESQASEESEAEENSNKNNIRVDKATEITPEIQRESKVELMKPPKPKEPEREVPNKKIESNIKNNKTSKKGAKHATKRISKVNFTKKSAPSKLPRSPVPTKLQNVKSRIKSQIEADKMKMKLKIQYGHYVNPTDNIVVQAREVKPKPVGNEAVKTASKFVQGSVAEKFLKNEPINVHKHTEKQWQTPPPYVEAPKSSHNLPISPIYSTPKFEPYRWDDDDLSSLEGGPLSPEMFEDENENDPFSVIKSAPANTRPTRVPDVPSFFNNWIGDYGQPHTRLVPKKEETPVHKNPVSTVHTQPPAFKKQKENFLWELFKSKLDQDLPQRLPQQLLQQIELELQLEEQQSKKKLMSSYTQTDKKNREAFSLLPTVNVDGTPIAASKAAPVEQPKPKPNIPDDIPNYFDKQDLVNETGMSETRGNLTFESLNQTVDTLALSQGLTQFRGATLRIARKLKQLETEREGLVERLLTTSYLPDVDIPSSSSSSGSDQSSTTQRSKPLSSTFLTTSTLTDPQTLTTSTLTTSSSAQGKKETVAQTKQEIV